MSQIDDLNVKIQEALAEVECLGSSMSDIDDLRRALGESNVRLRDNSDQLDKLISATDGFRSAVESSTRTLSVLASELARLDAAKLSVQVEDAEARLRDTVLAKSSELDGRVEQARADLKAQVDDAQSQLVERMHAQRRSHVRGMLALGSLQIVTAAVVVAAVLYVLG